MREDGKLVALSCTPALNPSNLFEQRDRLTEEHQQVAGTWGQSNGLRLHFWDHTASATTCTCKMGVRGPCVSRSSFLDQVLWACAPVG